MIRILLCDHCLLTYKIPVNGIYLCASVKHNIFQSNLVAKKRGLINLFHSNNLIREEFLLKMLTKCIIMLLAERCRCFSASIFFFQDVQVIKEFMVFDKKIKFIDCITKMSFKPSLLSCN